VSIEAAYLNQLLECSQQCRRRWGPHFAWTLAGKTPSPAGTTSDFNDLLATGTDGATGVYNALLVPTMGDWQTATALDASSFAADPQFIAPNGNAATGNLHIHPTNPTPIEAKGTLVASVVDDFDGETRAGLTPTDVGADAGNFVPTPP